MPKKHLHRLKQKSFLDASILTCEICGLEFVWDIWKQRYLENRKIYKG